MPAVADNAFILSTPDQRHLVFLEQSSGVIRGMLVDEGGKPVQASQLSALQLWLHLKDNTALPVGGINSVSDTDVLNDGTRGLIGNAKAITPITIPNGLTKTWRTALEGSASVAARLELILLKWIKMTSVSASAPTIERLTGE